MPPEVLPEKICPSEIYVDPFQTASINSAKTSKNKVWYGILEFNVPLDTV